MTMPTPYQVVVVGGGTMGADVAIVFARGGYPTQVIESNLDRCASIPGYVNQIMSESGYTCDHHLVSVAPNDLILKKLSLQNLNNAYILTQSLPVTVPVFQLVPSPKG